MREDGFKAWMQAEGFSAGTINSQMSKVRKLDRVFGDLDQLHASGGFDALEGRLRARRDLPGGLGNDGELRHLPKSLDYYRQFIEGRSQNRLANGVGSPGASSPSAPVASSPDAAAKSAVAAPVQAGDRGRLGDQDDIVDGGAGEGLAGQLAEVCRLQPFYTPENSPAMQRRGSLIRSHIPASLEALDERLRAALGVHGRDLAIGASDGIGRKTEAPWVRIHSKRLSPTPRDGFYVVIHFAADGGAVFVTVGCGSTIWANGELRAVSDAELDKRTQWARDEVVRARDSLEPFTDEIALGAKAALPRTFEKATAFSKRIERADLSEDRVEDLLVAAAERLAIIYDAQDIGADLSAPEQIALELEGRGGRRRGEGQGFGLTAPEKRAVEERAMTMAKAWLEGAGFSAKDTSKSAPFDFLAQRAGETLKIEVKGTTSEMADAIMVTKNEFELHRKELGSTGLIIVSGIRLDRASKPPIASGGDVTP